MSARIIDGKGIAADIRGELKAEVEAIRDETGRAPGLAAVLVGDDPASRIYVNGKRKACDEVGIRPEIHNYPDGLPENELLALINRLNGDPAIHGILVQLPLPDAVDSQRILDAVHPDKDVDGFHPVNVGRLMVGLAGPRPCTPAGIMELLARSDVPLNGRKAVVVGRSNIVGKPVAMMLLAEHATVTMCHSRTADLPAEVKGADIVIAAVGRSKLIQGSWLKPGATVIDVGMNRGADGKLSGDVDFDAACEVAGAITPVPGGVGPMTIAMLLKNTVELARQSAGRVRG
jgi:methylenetetrahydrofolate dehydrogenase (NADP+)/methenyltetrahydrofolate cyclohydrolase